MAIKRVGILFHPMVEATRNRAEELKKHLSSRGLDTWLCSAWEVDKARAQLSGTDLLFSTGGDGTILRTAQVALPSQTPIVGINLGKLGFLTELDADETQDRINELLEGKGWLDERAMLEAELFPTGKECQPTTFYALNDVVVARGAIARLINIETSIDGERLTTYRADGITLATATGSTGYSLAAGGPVLYPQSQDILLVPIVAHLGLGYSLVLPPTSVVKLQITTSHQATLSIDGHTNTVIASGAVIAVKHSSKKTSFLRIRPKDHFYSSLEQKLKGKR